MRELGWSGRLRLQQITEIGDETPIRSVRFDRSQLNLGMNGHLRECNKYFHGVYMSQQKLQAHLSPDVMRRWIVIPCPQEEPLLLAFSTQENGWKSHFIIPWIPGPWVTTEIDGLFFLGGNSTENWPDGGSQVRKNPRPMKNKLLENQNQNKLSQSSYLKI